MGEPKDWRALGTGILRKQLKNDQIFWLILLEVMAIVLWKFMQLVLIITFRDRRRSGPDFAHMKLYAYSHHIYTQTTRIPAKTQNFSDSPTGATLRTREWPKNPYLSLHPSQWASAHLPFCRNAPAIAELQLQLLHTRSTPSGGPLHQFWAHSEPIAQSSDLAIFQWFSLREATLKIALFDQPLLN